MVILISSLFYPSHSVISYQPLNHHIISNETHKSKDSKPTSTNNRKYLTSSLLFQVTSPIIVFSSIHLPSHFLAVPFLFNFYVIYFDHVFLFPNFFQVLPTSLLAQLHALLLSSLSLFFYLSLKFPKDKSKNSNTYTRRQNFKMKENKI